MEHGRCPCKATLLFPDSQGLLVLSGVICLPTILQTPSCFSWSLSLVAEELALGHCAVLRVW